MTTEEKLKTFYAVCTEDAKKDADADLAAFSKELDDAFETHKEQKQQEASAYIANEKASIERDLKRDYSEKQIDIRQNLASEQDLIRQKLFLKVSEKLQTIKGTEEYRNFLIRKAREARTIAGDDPLVLYIDPSDEAFQNVLEEAAGVRPLLSKEPFIGGTRAVIRARNILIDNSLKTLMEEEQSSYTFDPVS